jgi:uncharacterized membrane protein YhaH (DUF805 family)
MRIEPPTRIQIYGWIAWLLVISAILQLLDRHPWVAAALMTFAALLFLMIRHSKRIKRLGPPPKAPFNV